MKTAPSRFRNLGAALAAVFMLVACGGETGTITIRLVTEPGSELLERIIRLRVELTGTDSFREVSRSVGEPFTLDFTVDADGDPAQVTVKGYDVDGELIAIGASPPLPIAAIDSSVVVHVASPDSFSRALMQFPQARSEQATVGLSFAVLFAGGRGGDGFPTDEVFIYSAARHELIATTPLPMAIADATLLPGSVATAYLFGGVDRSGAAVATGYSLLITSTQTRYVALSTHPSLARSGADGAALGGERFAIAGRPGALLDGVNNTVSAIPAAPQFDGVLARATGAALPLAIVAGQDVAGIAMTIDFLGVVSPTAPPDALRRTGHGATTLSDGDVLFAGGSIDGRLSAAAVRYRSLPQTFEVIDDFLAVPRRNASVIAAGNRVLVIGGIDDDGRIRDVVEIFDRELRAVGTTTLSSPRAYADAHVLSTGQILVAGGVNENGQATPIIELFTPGE